MDSDEMIRFRAKVREAREATSANAALRHMSEAVALAERIMSGSNARTEWDVSHAVARGYAWGWADSAATHNRGQQSTVSPDFDVMAFAAEWASNREPGMSNAAPAVQDAHANYRRTGNVYGRA